MKPRLSADNLVASRSSALVFLPDERDQCCEPCNVARTTTTPGTGGRITSLRVHEHGSVAGQPIILVVGHDDFPEPVWRRVKDLVAFRLHRRGEDGSESTDAAIYLVQTSDLYDRAATALRADPTGEDPVWCFLAAVVTHEAAHTSEGTERQALEAEIAQLRRCQAAGHLPPSDGLRAVSSWPRSRRNCGRYDTVDSLQSVVVSHSLQSESTVEVDGHCRPPGDCFVCYDCCLRRSKVG